MQKIKIADLESKVDMGEKQRERLHHLELILSEQDAVSKQMHERQQEQETIYRHQMDHLTSEVEQAKRAKLKQRHTLAALAMQLSQGVDHLSDVAGQHAYLLPFLTQLGKTCETLRFVTGQHESQVST